MYYKICKQMNEWQILNTNCDVGKICQVKSNIIEPG